MDGNRRLMRFVSYGRGETMVAYLKFRVWVPEGTDVAYTVYETYAVEKRPLAVINTGDGATIYEVSDQPFEDVMPYETKVALVGEVLYDPIQPIFPANRLALYNGRRWAVFPLLSPPVPYDYTTGFGVYLGYVDEPTDPLSVSANPTSTLYILTKADDGYDVWAVYTTYEKAIAMSDGSDVALLNWDGLTFTGGVCDNAQTVMYTYDGVFSSETNTAIWFDDDMAIGGLKW